MKRLKKILLLAVAMLLAVVISITATIAYLKSQTDVVPNAFAVGKVKISLDESRVDKYGRLLDVDGNLWTADSGKAKAPRVTENSYTFVPGKTYVKDPVVHVAEDSEPCLVFVVIYLPGLESAPFYDNMCSQLRKNNTWYDLEYYDKVPEGLGDDYAVWGYNGTVQPGQDVQLFSTLTIKTDVTYEKIEKIDLSQLKITAYAFQDEGTANWTYEAAWAKLVELCDPFNQEK
jgi:hypothetical protein